MVETKFVPLSAEARHRLIRALEMNVEGKAMHTASDTSFTEEANPDATVICAVKDTACHY